MLEGCGNGQRFKLVSRAPISYGHNPISINKINIFYTNARSAMQNSNNLKLQAMAEYPYVRIISGTWLNTCNKHYIAEVSINGCNTFAKYRLHKKGDGVLKYTRGNIDIIQLNTTEMEEHGSIHTGDC